MGYHIVQVFASTFTSPFGGGTAWDLNGFTSDSTSSSGGGPSGSFNNTCRYTNFSTNFGGMGPNDIQRIDAVLDWSAGGNASVSVDSDGSASAGSQATGDTFGGLTGSAGFFRSCGASINGPGPASDSDFFSDGATATGTLLTNNISEITSGQCQASISGSAESGISGSTGSGSCDASISITPSFNVYLTDRRVIGC